MIIVLNSGVSEESSAPVFDYILSKGADFEHDRRAQGDIICVKDGGAALDAAYLEGFDAVSSVVRISEPYKLAGRQYHPESSIIDVAGKRFGGGEFQMIAGPCTVESDDQLFAVSKAVKDSGAGLLRGGAYKPRTSPYDFQGLCADGLRLLSEAKRLTGLPTVSEIMLPEQLPLFDDVDVLQVGARNMQNFELLKALSRSDKPVLLKRGFGNTVRELLCAAEYILSGGNDKVILCERGIRSFEPSTRNTLDISAVPVIHELSHLPVIVDPSHAAGYAKLVEPLALAAVAAGADGLIIEVHNEPGCALCDGGQSVSPSALADIVKKADAIRQII